MKDGRRKRQGTAPAEALALAVALISKVQKGLTGHILSALAKAPGTLSQLRAGG